MAWTKFTSASLCSAIFVAQGRRLPFPDGASCAGSFGGFYEKEFWMLLKILIHKTQLIGNFAAQTAKRWTKSDVKVKTSGHPAAPVKVYSSR